MGARGRGKLVSFSTRNGAAIDHELALDPIAFRAEELEVLKP